MTDRQTERDAKKEKPSKLRLVYQMEGTKPAHPLQIESLLFKSSLTLSILAISKCYFRI